MTWMFSVKLLGRSKELRECQEYGNENGAGVLRESSMAIEGVGKESRRCTELSLQNTYLEYFAFVGH